MQGQRYKRHHEYDNCTPFPGTKSPTLNAQFLLPVGNDLNPKQTLETALEMEIRRVMENGRCRKATTPIGMALIIRTTSTYNTFKMIFLGPTNIHAALM